MSITRVLVFLAILATLLFGLHYYVWARLVRDTHLPAPWSALVTWGTVALSALLVVGMAGARSLPRAVLAPVLWVAFTWMGVAFFFLVLMASADFARVLVSLTRQMFSDAPIDPARRLAIERILGAFVAFGTLALGGAAVANGIRRVGIKRLRVALRRLSRAKDGYRIVQLTDIHVGPTIGKDFIEELVARTNALRPDLVAITGDLVDGSVEQLAEHVAPLAKLRAKDGVYFVTGNHEYYSGVDAWMRHLATLGVRVLRNERVSIGGEDGFDLAGIDDATAHQFGEGHGADLPRALDGRDPTRAVVLLAHQPKAVVEAARHGVDFQISGHTHGGQMFPFNWLVKLVQPYVAGLHVHEGTTIYVSRGTGYWGPPMRLGAPAEITEIELGAA